MIFFLVLAGWFPQFGLNRFLIGAVFFICVKEKFNTFAIV